MRVFGISLAVFVTLIFILSRFESDTVTRTINKFPSIKQQWQARAAAMQSHFSHSSNSASSNAAACDADEKTCMAPYKSQDPDKEAKPMKDQTPSEYDSADSKDGKRPSVKDEDRDKDRGFTDAEQAAALERLEFKYGAEAKADTDKVMWMESTTTTTGWGADPTEALNSEEEKARKMLGEEYGDLKATTTGTADATATPEEKGWRTTGFETKTKTSQKSLISGGGGNGTAAPTATGTQASSSSDEFEVVAETNTNTKKGKKPSKTAADEAMITSKPKSGSKKPTKKPADEDEEDNDTEDYEVVTSTKKGKSKGTKTAATEDDAEATPTSKGRWDD